MTAKAMTLATATVMDDRPPTACTAPSRQLPAPKRCNQQDAPGDDAAASPLRRRYLRCLTLAFTVFSSIRVLTYLPTIWAIHAVGDSGQYSVWTWVAWIGGNVSMAAWLYENNGQRVDSAVVVTIANALMCLATCATIVYYRL